MAFVHVGKQPVIKQGVCDKAKPITLRLRSEDKDEEGFGILLLPLRA